MKRSLLAGLLAVGLLLGSSVPAQAAPDDIIRNDDSGIPDYVIYEAALEENDRNDDMLLTVREAQGVRKLKLHGDSVTDFTGIDRLSGLTSLSVMDSATSDYSPVRELRKLDFLGILSPDVTPDWDTIPRRITMLTITDTDVSALDSLPAGLTWLEVNDSNPYSHYNGDRSILTKTLEYVPELEMVDLTWNDMAELPDMTMLDRLGNSYGRMPHFTQGNRISSTEFFRKVPSHLFYDRDWVEEEARYFTDRWNGEIPDWAWDGSSSGTVNRYSDEEITMDSFKRPSSRTPQLPKTDTSSGASSSGSSSSATSSKAASSRNTSSQTSSGGSSSGASSSPVPTEQFAEDSATGISAQIPASVSNVYDPILTAVPVVEGSDEAKNLERAASQYRIQEAYDINLFSNRKAIGAVRGGRVTLSIPFPQGKEGQQYLVLRQNGDGSIDELSGVCREGQVVFQTDHFSVFAITSEGGSVDPNRPSPTPGNAQTGDSNLPLLFAAGGIALGAGIAASVFCRKKVLR